MYEVLKSLRCVQESIHHVPVWWGTLCCCRSWPRWRPPTSWAPSAGTRPTGTTASWHKTSEDKWYIQHFKIDSVTCWGLDENARPNKGLWGSAYLWYNLRQLVKEGRRLISTPNLTFQLEMAWFHQKNLDVLMQDSAALFNMASFRRQIWNIASERSGRNGSFAGL